MGCGRKRCNAIVAAVPRQQNEGQPAGGAGGGGFGLNAKERKRLKYLEEMAANKGAQGTQVLEVLAEEAEAEVEPPKVSVPVFGIHTLNVMKDPMKAFALPAKAEWDKTPAQVVNEAKICKDTSESMGLRAKVVKYRAIITTEEEADKDAHYLEIMRKVLKETEGLLAKLSKGSTGATAVEAMKAKMRDANKVEEARLEEYATKEGKILEKMDAMQEAFDLQITEIKRRKEVFLTHRLKAAQLYAEDATARISRHQSIKAAWEAKIHAEEEAMKTGKVAQVAAEEQVEEAKDVEVEAAEADTDYGLDAPWSTDDLPAMEKPETGEYEFWINLSAAVNEWAGTHCAAPCTYGQLTGPGDASVLIKSVVKLIGISYWRKLYGDRQVNLDDVVPRHLGYVLGHALSKPREMAMKELGGAEKLNVEAKKKVKEVMADSKKGLKAKGALGIKKKPN